MYLIGMESKWRHSFFHRIMMGVCLADLIFSVGNMMHPFMLPSDTGLLYAFGNAVTCNIAGFLIPTLSSSMLYSCILSTYFFLTITRGWNEEKATRAFEPWIHIAIWGSQILPASLMFVLGGYAPSELRICSAVRGDEAHKMAQVVVSIAHAVAVLSAVAGFVLIWLMYVGVRRQRLRIQRYHIPSSLDTSDRDNQTKAVATQAVFYSLAFLNTFIAIVVFGVAQAIVENRTAGGHNMFRHGRVFFYSTLPFYFTLPLQGFLNWIIYIRPNLMRWKNANEEKSLLWAYKKLLSGEAVPKIGTSASGSVSIRGAFVLEPGSNDNA